MQGKLLFAYIFLSTSVLSYAQVNAYFTVSDSEGCVPLVVSFTNQSTGTGTLTYSWNFGNSQNSVLEQPWPINYVSPGVYNVTLTVSDGTSTSTFSQTVTVFANPTANFSFSGNTQGCLPISLSFNDLSVPSAAPINQWFWEFGDGGTSVQQNPSYSYYTPGTYNAQMTVTDTNGCSNTKVISPVAQVSPIPVINVAANPSNHCVVPATVQFINNSTGLQPLSFNWNFGDGGTSSQTSPSHTYTQLGVYNVSVTVTDPNGCSQTATYNGMVNINTVTASFTISTGSFTVCPFQWFTLVNTSGYPSSLWTFGTGASSIQNSPYFMYPFPGTYPVTLISAPNTACADTVTHMVTVEDYQATILVDPSSLYACEVPVDFTYSYSGWPASELHWIIEDPDEPAGFAEDNGSNITYTYTYETPHTYDVTLYAMSSTGCRDTVSIQININPVIANPTVDTLEGCVPLSVHFSENSYSNEPIVSWQWNFDDGGTSVLQSPDHTFDTIGIFVPTLTVVNDLGCSDTKPIIRMRVGYRHLVNFSICNFLLPTTDSCKFCPMDTIQFTNLTADSMGNLFGAPCYLYPSYPTETNWTWFFGPDEFEPNHPIPLYFATTDTGWQYNLSLIINYLGCESDVLFDPPFDPETIRLYVYGPRIRSLNCHMSCDDPMSRTYVANVFNWEYINWDMGDGTIFSNTLDTSVFYTYADTGEYIVVCTAYNDSVGCFFRNEMNVKITDIKAVILPELGDTICRGTSLLLSADSSQFNIWNQWTVNNTVVSTTGTMSYLCYTPPPFLTSGDYPAMLVVSDMYNCYDTAVVNIHVTEPVPSFTADPLFGCAPLPVTFTSTSTTDLEIESVTWNFGDNTPSVTGLVVNHTYNLNGAYNIIMTVTDTLGCVKIDTMMQVIQTGTALAAFSSPHPYCCFGDTVYLNNLSSGSQPVYYWDFGNGTNSSQTSPSVLYSQPGIYTVTLIVNDNLGCSDTLTMPDYFHVQFAEASFSISVTDTNCYPFFPTIVNNSPQEFNPLCEWNFGDGFISYNYNPGHTYNFPGDFWITLNVLTSAGCNDRDSVLVHVGGPFASIIVSDSLVCAGDEVFYNLADTLNVNSLNWNFGDGAGSASYSTSHVYDYVPAGNNFFVSLVYCSEPSCCLTAQDTVGVYEVIAGFGILDAVTQIPDTAHCPPALLAFPNTSSGATNWVWDMGNGTLFNGYQPGAQTYDNFTEQPYTVTVSQIIHNDIGCKDTLLREILIWGKPPVSVSNDTLICRGNTLVLTATGGSSIVWRPNEHLTDSISYQITVKPDSSVCYYAQVSDSIGCRNSDSVIVWVQQVPLLSHNNDTIIIIGEYVQLCAVSDQSNITYVWSPGEYINCTDCPCPLARPLEDITYQIAIQDSMKCFTVYGTVFIEVTEAYTLDLPVVFTPNGDGANDRVYVRGWGIKQLMEFSIYNRWGERVYYSDDLYEGWDGTFKGKALDMDTYTYYVKVLAFDNKIRDKKGNITLLR